MTDLLDDTRIDVLDHGFVAVLATMGSDEAIANAARISYGKGTRQVSQDNALIRYLIRNQHWSPVEQVQIQFHMKCPVFVARQLFRHRTMSINEMSARYSIMDDEFYLPDATVIQPQSNANKQGRAGEIDARSKDGVQWIIQTSYEQAYAAYNVLLGEREHAEEHYDPYSPNNPLLSVDYAGVSRELARMVLPVGLYTEFVFSINLRNLFHLLKLRMDSHAQYEIQQFSNAMFSLIKPRFPLACGAASDYLFEAETLSRMEMTTLRAMLARSIDVAELERQHGGEKDLAEHYHMTLRELRDFKTKLAVAPV